MIPCEPLHDITNIVQHIILELPHYIDDKKLRTEMDLFVESTIGNKNQIKGPDARRCAVGLAKFTNKRKDKVDKIVQL